MDPRPDGGSAEPAVIEHPWTSAAPGWAPTAADGTRLDVVPETLQHGPPRQVCGRHLDPDTFQVIDPRTGEPVHTLHRSGPPDRPTWREPVLSPADARYFTQVARDAGWTPATPLPAHAHGAQTPETAHALDLVRQAVAHGQRPAGTGSSTATALSGQSTGSPC